MLDVTCAVTRRNGSDVEQRSAVTHPSLMSQRSRLVRRRSAWHTCNGDGDDRLTTERERAAYRGQAFNEIEETRCRARSTDQCDPKVESWRFRLTAQTQLEPVMHARCVFVRSFFGVRFAGDQLHDSTVSVQHIARRIPVYGSLN